MLIIPVFILAILKHTFARNFLIVVYKKDLFIYMNHRTIKHKIFYVHSIVLITHKLNVYWLFKSQDEARYQDDAMLA